MVDTGIFATTAEVIRKTGVEASAVSATADYINDYMAQVESYINVVTGKNWSDIYATLNADVKGILKEAASNLAAMYVITYDMSSWNSQIAAEDLIQFLSYRADKCIAALKVFGTNKFISEA